MRSILKSELGQMSIFLALIFQVLFVFFAMVINIGLLVHDKINLQNSVDLGAFYAAQKQAEILNEIAHLNYQIRQDYKLLAWRYWVLGTLDRDAQGLNLPPAVNPTNFPDGVRLYRPDAASPLIEEVPVSCLANPMWWEFARLSGTGIPPNENYCWKAYNGVPSQTVAVVAGPMTPATAGANAAAYQFAQYSSNSFGLSCVNASPLSWAFVASIMTNYKFSIAYKKKAIKKLRENLVSANPTDRDGRPIRDGVIATIQRNLTESNLASFNPTAVQMLNGLTRGGCDGGNFPGAKTLPEILTQPGLYFALLSGTPANACTFQTAFQTQFGLIQGGVGVAHWDPSGLLRQMVTNEPGQDDQYHSTLGFEKNPWCMAYMGVKAATSPRKPFAPFGKSVNLEARSFAQPFGGRIGPWYSKTWARESPTSDDVPMPSDPANPLAMNPIPAQAARRTDPVTSPRISPGAGNFIYSSLTIPNFSRYPGDNLGLRSMFAQSLMRPFFQITRSRMGSPANNSFGDNRLRLYWFFRFGNMDTTGDSLAFDEPAAAAGTLPPSMATFRQIEAAAVAPDLFDITYYSIDPEANLNYTALARANPARYGIPGAPMGDLGSRETVALMRDYNVQKQITATTVSVDQSLMSNVYWLVRKWEHLLTGWAPNSASNFGFPTARFGECTGLALPNFMIPGKCSAGGRTGYSVRTISREHLQGPWSVGGDGIAANTLLNAPPNDIDF